MYEIDFAKDLINRNEYNKAISVLNKIIRKNNKDADAFFELGKVFFIKNNFKKAIINFKNSINIKESFYAYLLLAKSLKNIGQYRNSLKILFKIKKSSIEILENIDVEVVNCFVLLKKYLYAYEYFDKYSIKDSLLQKQIIYKLFVSYINKNNKLLKGIENFVYKFLNSNEDDDKMIIEKQMLRLYERNCLIQKEKFYKYILSKNNNKNNDKNKKHYNYILNRIETKRRDIKLYSKPTSLIVTLTNACNIKCDFCGIRKEKLWHLPEKKIREIIDLMPYLKSVSWLGGEVFLYKEFDKLFDNAVDNNVVQEIITNGLLLNSKLIKKFIKTPMKLSISVTSVNKKNYELLHKGASFRKLLSNLKIIKNNINKRNENFSYWLYVCVMKENFMELEDIIEFAHKYKFDTVRFQPLGQLNSSFYNKDIVKYFINKAIIKAKKYNMKINNIIPVDFSSYQEIKFSKKQIKEEISKICFVKENFKDKIKITKKKYLSEISDKIKKDINATLEEDIEEDIKENMEVMYTRNKIYPLIDKRYLFCKHPWSTMIINYGGEITFDCSCPLNKLDTVNNKLLVTTWNSLKVQKFREKIKKGNVYDICNYNCIMYNIHKN